MKKQFLEFICLMLISACIGIIVGILDVFFGKILLIITDFRVENYFVFIPLLPIAGLIIVYIYKHVGERVKKGIQLVFDVANGHEDDIPLLLIPVLIVTTWITHLFGGSAGREGVAVQIGATIGHRFSQFFKKDNLKRTFIICGMAAGFSGLFQTPVAAIFFALEVLWEGKIQIKTIILTIIASFSAYMTSQTLHLEQFKRPVYFQQGWDFALIFKLLILAVCFGLCGYLFICLLKAAKQFLARFMKNEYKRIFYIGIILAILLFVFDKGRYSGLGTNLINASFMANHIFQWDFILKLIFTVVTLSIGFQGGEVTPLFAIGATLGYVISSVIGLPTDFCVALGYCAVFGCATNTFIAPMMIGAEVFGFELMPYLFIVCAIAYVFNRNRSIYTSQIKAL